MVCGDRRNVFEDDKYLDIPKRALKEAIVNAYCHRDYTLSVDIKVEFYDDRVQIFSPGSLPDGLTLENIKMGMVAKCFYLKKNLYLEIRLIESIILQKIYYWIQITP